MSANGLVYLNIHGRVVGPLALEVVRTKAMRGELRPGTRWSSDRATWRDLEQLPGEEFEAAGSQPAGRLSGAPTGPVQTVENWRAPPPPDRDGPPPVPPEAGLRRLVALSVGGIALLCVLIGLMVWVGRGEFGTRNKNNQVAQGDEAPPEWGAADPRKNPAQPEAPAAPAPVEKAPDNGKKEEVKPAPAKEAAPPMAPAAPMGELKVEDLVRKCEPSVAVLKNAKGAGSGFLVEANLVATNQHVAGDVGDQVIVRFPSADGLKDKEFRGTVVRADETRDLALVRLREAPGPPALELGDEKSLKKGQDIVVIGSPGLGNAGDVIENAVRKGNFSTNKELAPFGEVLELGVAINPGNSGGPVFDMAGRVAGVAVAKGVAVEAVGFAVPVSQLREMVRKQRTGAR